MAEDPPATGIAQEAGEIPPSNWRGRILESAGDNNFRWFYLSMLGQMASLNMQMLVRGFLTYELTGSYAALGTVFLFNAIPGIALSLYGGVLADRVRNKKIVLQVGQSLNAVNAIVVGLLVLTDIIAFEHLILASFLQGGVNAIMMPARQAMMPEVVGRRRLMNAVALNAAGRDSIRLLAPAAGGALLAAFDASWIYFLMAGFYTLATVALIRVHTNALGPSAPPPTRWGRGGMAEVRDGLRYLWGDPTMRPLLVSTVVFALLAMPYIFLMPGWVASVLDEGPGKLGILLSLVGVGSLFGAIVIAAMPSRRRGLLYLAAVALEGAALIAYSVSEMYWVTAGIIIVVGLGEAGRMSLGNVLVQNYVVDEYRGRAMSVFMMQRSLASLGTFFVGVLASAVGVQVVIGGLAVALCLLALIGIFVSPVLRRLD
ncbi:MAG TPA: MFS transporter [Dehalococcoidia bacterium]|nr:MFS transporter [Dehalococcoidia bacterium]